MNKFLFLIFVLPVLVVVAVKSVGFYRSVSVGGAPPYAPEDLNPPSPDRFAWLNSWQRPEGPPSVALQVGHWKNDELPDELSRLKGSTGSSGAGLAEWEVAMGIAGEAKKILEKRGIKVDILPATVPPMYFADVFVSIHADGSLDTSKSGYKIAAPRRDYSGKAAALVSAVEETYGYETGLDLDPNVTRNMRGYYAFAWWRYEHAIHPKAASGILETGFLTNPGDRSLLINNPDLPARGLSSGIINFLEKENLL